MAKKPRVASAATVANLLVPFFSVVVLLRIVSAVSLPSRDAAAPRRLSTLSAPAHRRRFVRGPSSSPISSRNRPLPPPPRRRRAVVPPCEMSCASVASSERCSAAASRVVSMDSDGVDAYLRQIQRRLVETSSSCSSDDGSRRRTTFRRRLSEPNRTPMIRTLLGLSDDKVRYDSLVRDARNELTYRRLECFVRDDLRERLRTDERAREKVPHLPDVIESLLEGSGGDFDGGAGSRKRQRRDAKKTFQRLGSGRTYRGNVAAMLSDVAPDLLPRYEGATRDVDDEEALREAIDALEAEEGGGKRIMAEEALRCLSSDAFGVDVESSSEEEEAEEEERRRRAPTPKENGVACEKRCVAYLEERGTDEDAKFPPRKDEIVLNNVHVLSRTSKSASYKPPLPSRRKTVAKGAANGDANENGEDAHENDDDNDDNKYGDSGVVWTRLSRDRTTSEFDAMVLRPWTGGDGGGGDRPNEASGGGGRDYYVAEVWEAKHSVSPSTLHDVLTKKAAAFRALTEEGDGEDNDGACLMFRGGRVPLSRSRPPSGASTIVDAAADAATAADVESSDAPKRRDRVTFGIYGTELQPPANAAGQMKAIAAARALNGNVDAVLRALDEGYVEVETESALRNLAVLRDALKKVEGCFDVALVVG